ncbi:MAG: hypothetical protein Q8N44_20540 [Rubrivivax sp.]|nr:hypothetical protein [Rubrivivax sp.]MDP3086065.1 hypothetical protein [Rubrivivax sp.]
MIALRILFVALFAASIALTAQSQPVAAASAPMTSALMPRDCANPIAKHDHGAERGLPTAKSMSGPCAPAAAASAPKAKLPHDHAKFHKNQ